MSLLLSLHSKEDNKKTINYNTKQTDKKTPSNLVFTTKQLKTRFFCQYWRHFNLSDRNENAVTQFQSMERKGEISFISEKKWTSIE